MEHSKKDATETLAAHILVVDDEPDVEALFSLRFRKEIRAGQLQFSFAENGLRALELLQHHGNIDLVLSDINMPEMDGLTLLSKIRANFPLIQVVMVTAYGDLENIRAAMNAGSFDFLNKPFSMADLKVTIGNALEQVANLRALHQAENEKRQAQDALVENLRQMDKLKDEFLANTTHELNTPLNGMLGLAEGMLGGTAGNLTAKAKQDLHLMVTAGHRLQALIGDILDFSKIRQQKLRLNRRPCRLAPVFDQVLEFAQPLTKEKRIRLKKVIPEDLPAVLADDARLLQVLKSLVENAIKFTDKGSVSLGAAERESGVVLYVQDTGKGIPPDQQQQIFNAFEQLDGSMTRAQGGTGLGLAISKQILMLHGATLHLDSVLGQGTRFEFVLPFAEEAAQPDLTFQHPKKSISVVPQPKHVAETSPIPAFESKPATWSVLAVDDEPLNLQVLVNQLSLSGIHVEPVSSGEEALKKLAGNTGFDLIILDVMMPGMSGLEVCQQIRKSRSMSDLPVLMLTARNRPEDVVAGIEAGANDYLTKPFDRAELMARVKNLATLRHAVRHALEQARELGAERKQREQLEFLRQFNQDLSSTLELREVLQRFLNHVHDCAPHDLAFFCLKIEERFDVVAERGEIADDKGLREFIYETCSVWSEMLKVRAQPTPLQLSDNHFEQLQGAWLGIPMNNRGKLIGTLFLLRRQTPLFLDHEIQLANTFVGQGCLAIENARLFEQVRHLAMTDALTGLYNRRFFFMEGQLAIDRAMRFENPVSLMLLDIDHFKKFNDQFGHAVGDLVLQRIAQTIKTQCRVSDIAGRYGGEEMAVLMPQTIAGAAQEAAERFRQAIANLVLKTEDDQELRVTVSIGVATYHPEDGSLDKLLGRADQALYMAKGAGRNRVIWAESSQEVTLSNS